MDETLLRLSRQVDEKRYGKYRGFVSSNKDPERRARLKLRVPSVLGDEETDWALPCVPFGGLSDQGFFAVPENDAQVWVEFEEGDIHRPLWVGTFWQTRDDVPEDAKKNEEPTTRLLQTPSGHILQFDDEEGHEKFRLHHAKDAEVLIDENGSISLTDPNGAVLKIDADNEQVTLEDSNGNKLTMSSSGTTVEDSSGNKIEMSASGVTVSASAQVVVKGSQVMLGGDGGEPVIKGMSFLTLFQTHVHPSAMGPTGPPIPQGEQSALSTVVMTS